MATPARPKAATEADMNEPGRLPGLVDPHWMTEPMA